MTKERKTNKHEKAGAPPDAPLNPMGEEETADQPQTPGANGAQTYAEQEPGNPWADRLDKAEAEREEYLNLAQRVQADFDNFRRRNQSVRAEATQDGANNVLTQLLPVLDNLERAIEAAAAQGEQGTSLGSGVELILRQLRDAMGKFGVAEINRVGEKFDPNLENAVMQADADSGEPGTVCEVFQKGYKTESKVLRYAMVKVVVG